MSIDIESLSFLEEKEEISTKFSIESALQEDVVIVDWDDTLFPTSYLQNYLLDYSSIFSGKSNLEQGYSFLLSELNELEKVNEINLVID